MPSQRMLDAEDRLARAQDRAQRNRHILPDVCALEKALVRSLKDAGIKYPGSDKSCRVSYEEALKLVEKTKSISRKNITDATDSFTRAKRAVEKWMVKLDRTILAKPRVTRKEAWVELRSLIDDRKRCGCALCDEEDRGCLTFHHKDTGTKLFPISDTVTLRPQSITPVQLTEEMAKCIVVCANCHQKIHKGTVSVDVE